MARDYPTYLFSHPLNSKSKGPFIIHTLSPEYIIRISPLTFSKAFDIGNYIVEFVKLPPDYTSEILFTEVKSYLNIWMMSQPELKKYRVK